MEIKNRTSWSSAWAARGGRRALFRRTGGPRRARTRNPSLLQDALDELAGLPGGFELLPYDESLLQGADLVVPSPGVPPFNPLLLAACRRGFPVLSELEIASRFLRPPMIAISGTNGKTTTTTLAGHLLEAAGKKVFVGGNIGRPLMEYVRGPQTDDWVVVEVSSFQLQWVETFRPALAALLNVTCDHVDYHGSFEAYREVKERLFACQTGADAAVLNGDDAGTAALAPRLAARVLRFSSTVPLEGPGIYAAGEELICSLDGHTRETYPLSMIRLPGRHNVENVMAALLLARLSGCPADTLAEAVSRFSGVAHRIEYVATKKGRGLLRRLQGHQCGRP
jgi:UDP-N-acetylmuramoylalanine--D-glutamate ligase